MFSVHINFSLNKSFSNRILIAMFRSLIGLMVIAHVGAFIWVEDDEHLDAVVGISLYHEPLCTGVFIGRNTILTSASPLEGIWYEHGKHLRVTEVIYSYDRNLTYHAREVGFNQSNRNKDWIIVGHRNSKHTTIHDLMLIRIHESRFNITHNMTTWHMRRKFYTPIATELSYYSPDDIFYFAGFGFVDEEHVRDSNFLDVEYLPVSTRAECDEWIPREWGRFFCFYDFNNLAGVPSGAPLYHGANFIPGLSPVYGIGAFSLSKGRETILVFTDLRPYLWKLHSWTWTWPNYDHGPKYNKEPFLPYITNVGPIVPDFVPPQNYEPPNRYNTKWFFPWSLRR